MIPANTEVRESKIVNFVHCTTPLFSAMLRRIQRISAYPTEPHFSCQNSKVGDQNLFPDTLLTKIRAFFKMNIKH